MLITSCKKEVDNEFPYVKVLVPTENADFNVLDTISVTVEARDNKQLEYVKISITDENFTPVIASVFVYPNEKEVFVNRAMVIDNQFLESGDYYIVAVASDGENERTNYRKVQIFELRRKLLGVWFVEQRTANNQMDVYTVDTNFQKQMLSSVSGKFGASVCGNRYGTYSIAGGVSGDLNTLNAETGIGNWTVQSEVNPPENYFNDLEEHEGVIYVSSSDSEIRGFGETGNVRFSANTGSANPYDLFVNDSYVFAEQRQISGAERELALYYKDNGVLYQSKLTDLDITAFCERDENHLLVVGNTGGQGYLKEYDVEENGFWQPKDLPTGLVNSATKVDENNFLIAHETGILWYSYNQSSLVNIVSGISPSEIKFDDIDQIIIVSEGNEISYFGFPNGNLIQTISHGAEVKGMDILYNK